MTTEPKICAPLYAKEVKFADGGSILKLSGKGDKLIAWIEANVNDRDYINLVVSRRREVSQYGHTHSVVLDTWKPNGESAPEHNTTTETKADQEDRLPF